MKKWMVMLVALMMAMGNALAEAPVFEGMAGQIIADMGVGWNLGNTLDSNGEWLRRGSGAPKNYETAWGNPLTSQELIQTVADAGFKTIRLPVTWDHQIGPAPEYQVKRAWMDRVQAVVDYCMEAGVYCILNVHHDTGTDGWLHASQQDLEEDSAKFTALWTQIAQRFQNYGEKLIFEGFNEMLDEKNNWGYPGKQAIGVVNFIGEGKKRQLFCHYAHNMELCLRHHGLYEKCHYISKVSVTENCYTVADTVGCLHKGCHCVSCNTYELADRCY